MVLAYASMQLLVTLLLLVICSHVAILVYARTAMRQSEIAVRTALGASRARIVAQLFGEALALSAISSVIGLAIIRGVLSQFQALLIRLDVEILPFWIKPTISAETIGYVVALAVLGAFIVGVIPALQVTGGRSVGASLQRLVGGHATVRLGRTWTAIIVAEVAVSVAVLPLAVRLAWDAVDGIRAGPGFAADQYLSASVGLDRIGSAVVTAADQRTLASQFARARDELVRRLEAEPGIADVTYSERPPGSETGSWVGIDTSGPSAAASGAATERVRYHQRRARVGRVGVDFFAAFDVRLLAGRGFGQSDADSTARTVIVNRSFVDSVFHGRNALGRRVRAVAFQGRTEITGPWYEIVGVVEDFPRRTGFDASQYAVYHAASAHAHPMSLSVRMRGTDPATLIGRLRAITADVKPPLQLADIRPLDDVIGSTHLPGQLIALALVTVTLSILILSAAGIFALMSVTVTQRRREIGIRVALGASRRRVLTSIFARAGKQLGAGVVVGLGGTALLNAVTEGEVLGPRGTIILAGVSLFMMTVGALAALGPARRGLSVQPTIALRED
jgi:predicted permease